MFSTCIFFSFQSQYLTHCLLFSKELPARMLLLIKYLGKTGQTNPSPSKSKYENAILQTIKNFLFITVHFWGVQFNGPVFFFGGGGGGHSHLWFVCMPSLSMLGSLWNKVSIKLLAKCQLFCSFKMPLVITLVFPVRIIIHTLCNYPLITNN